MADKKADIKLSERPSKGEAIVGTAAEYAAYVNFGTRRQSAQPFLSTAGEIVSRKLTGTISEEMLLAMYKGLKKSFNKQIKNGVEIIRYGNPVEAISEGTIQSLLKASVAVTSQAKALSPVDGGYLRNSIMWRTEKDDGGFNK